jgi:hypothetical protein
VCLKTHLFPTPFCINHALSHAAHCGGVLRFIVSFV